MFPVPALQAFVRSVQFSMIWSTMDLDGLFEVLSACPHVSYFCVSGGG